MFLHRFLLLPLVWALSGVGSLVAEPQAMPMTHGQSLSGHVVVLPAALAGHAAVIVIGFSHSSSKAMERWDKEIGAQVTAKPGVALYNIAVIEDAPKFVRGMIKGSMRALVPAAGQDHFLTVVEGQQELKSAVDFSGGDDAYIVVLNGAGKIVFHTHGDPSDAIKKQVIDRIKD